MVCNLGNGPFLGMSGYLQHISLVHKIKLLISNLVILMRILSGAYPPCCSSSTYRTRFEEPAHPGKSTPAPSSQEINSFGDFFIRSMLTGRGISHKSTELFSHAWREGTTVRRWGEYCCQRKIDSLTPPVNEVINFLSSLFEMGLGYGGIASARSALGNFVTIPEYPRLADHPLIQKLKQSKPTCKPKPVVFHKYPHNEHLCPVRLVQVYMEKRACLPSGAAFDAFFLTHRRPHHPAAKDTIARWVKTVLHLSGVDIDIYKPHSFRSASTSHAKLAGVPLKDILRAGQWKSSDCFTTFLF